MGIEAIDFMLRVKLMSDDENVSMAPMNVTDIVSGCYKQEHLQYIYEIIQKLSILDCPLEGLVWFLEQWLTKSKIFFMHHQEHILLEIGCIWLKASIK